MRPYSGQKYRPYPIVMHGRNNANVVLSQESFSHAIDDPSGIANNAYSNVTINHTERHGADTIALDISKKRGSKTSTNEKYQDKISNAKSTVLSLKSKEVSNNSVTRYMNRLMERKMEHSNYRNRYD